MPTPNGHDVEVHEIARRGFSPRVFGGFGHLLKERSDVRELVSSRDLLCFSDKGLEVGIAETHRPAEQCFSFRVGIFHLVGHGQKTWAIPDAAIQSDPHRDMAVFRGWEEQ